MLLGCRIGGVHGLRSRGLPHDPNGRPNPEGPLCDDHRDSELGTPSVNRKGGALQDRVSGGHDSNMDVGGDRRCLVRPKPIDRLQEFRGENGGITSLDTLFH